MQFIDQANIILKAGKGGNGIVSFRREKFVPAGGPSGGNGGRGGSVILMADNNLQTLLDFKFKREIIAEDGCKGGPNKRSGASGEDRILKVPCGTEIRDIKSGIILGDLTKDKQSLTIAIGGRGGHGNAYYLSNQNRAPESFTEGKDGEIWEVQLELKLLAEVGIIGLPNAGKSTLLSVLSQAKPEIADYPFTTLRPNLGIVGYRDHQSFIMADIPGIIEGAHQGKGLGLRFLRHIERNSILLFMVPADSDDIKKEYKILFNELKKYNPELLLKDRILAISKSDMLDDELKDEMYAKIKGLHEIRYPYNNLLY